MMFEPKRLHPISIILGIGKNIREIIIPTLIYFFYYFLREPSSNKWIQASPVIFGVVAFLIIVISNIIRWARYTYRLENNELRIEHGLFIKKKRYIPFERIHSLNFYENLLHRPFQLVKVKVETAAGNNFEESEAELTALKKEEALQMRRIILEAKAKNVSSEEKVEEQQENDNVLYKMTRKQLIFFASTSGKTGVIISAILAFLSQFEDWIPYQKVFQHLESFVRNGIIFVLLVVAFILFFIWLLSVLWAYLKYKDFTLTLDNDELTISYGLFEKRVTTIPLKKVQAIRITESIFRQPFGYASVQVEYAGQNFMDENQTEGLIIPVIKKKDIGNVLAKAFPTFHFDVDLIGAPERAKRRFYLIKVLFFTIGTIVASIWLWPYSLIGIVFILLGWILGVFQYRSAGWKITGDQLTLRFRDIQQTTFLVKRNRLQSFKVSVNWFQKRANVASISTAVMSTIRGYVEVKHLEAEDVWNIYEWYRPRQQQERMMEPTES